MVRRRRTIRRWNATAEQLETRALLSGLSLFQKFDAVDWTSAGAGGIGSVGGGQATLTVGPVTGTIAHAYLYWQGVDRGFGPNGTTDGIYDNADVTFEGQAVLGTSLGMGVAATGSASARSQAFRADVTRLVRSGSQTYNVGGLASKAGHDANGVSLVVIYQDGDAANDRTLYILDGNHVNAGFNSDGEWKATIGGFVGSSGDVRAQLHVADGQSSGDAAIRFESSTGGAVEIEDDGSLFDGGSVADMGHSRAFNGSLWDVHTFNLGSLATPGSQTLTFSQLEGTQDAIALVALFVDTSAKPPNTPPVASELNVSGSEDQTVSGHLPGFDADGDALTYAVVTPPDHGVLKLDPATGNFTFTPRANFYGDLTFTYRVWDSEGASSDATVRMTFAPVNDSPVVEPLQVSLNEDSALDGRISAADVDDAILSYLLVKGPDHGTLQLTSDGSFHFSPNADWYGTDSFTVAVSDGKADLVLIVVPVHVLAVNDAPHVNGTVLTVPINAVNGDLLGTVVATDADRDSLTYAIAAGNDGSFAIDTRTGAITLYDAALLRRGGPREIVLTISATDPSGASAMATIVVRVQTPSVKMRVGYRKEAVIHLHGSPWVPLVIYGGDTLNVRDIDLNTLRFGRTGNESSLRSIGRPQHHFRDVDGDGKLDLVLLVDVRKTGLNVGDSSVFLKGATKSGVNLNGSSPVTVASHRNNGKSQCGLAKAKPAHANVKAAHPKKR